MGDGDVLTAIMALVIGIVGFFFIGAVRANPENGPNLLVEFFRFFADLLVWFVNMRVEDIVGPIMFFAGFGIIGILVLAWILNN